MPKYHESKRKHHSGGSDESKMFHAEHDQGYYEGDMSRRTQEMQDAGMIREDRSCIANLPQNVMIKPYEMSRSYRPDGNDDTIRGIDGQIAYDSGKRNKTFHPEKV